MLERICLLIFAGALLGLAPGLTAKNKGHSFWVRWLFGTALWIVALPVSIWGLDRNQATFEGSGQRERDDKKCPYCAETIKRDAIVCKHGGRHLPTQASQVVTFTARQPDPTLPPLQSTGAVVLRCPSCKTYNPTNSLSCARCGTDLRALRPVPNPF